MMVDVPGLNVNPVVVEVSQAIPAKVIPLKSQVPEPMFIVRVFELFDKNPLTPTPD